MKPLIIGNWKVYLSPAQSRAVARSLVRIVHARVIPETVLCPSAPMLGDVAAIVKRSKILLGAQDLDPVALPASTGSIAPNDLRAIGCQYVIVGHSERRAAGETDLQIRLKLKAAFAAGLKPILCVGETSQERASGHAIARVQQQLRIATRHLPLKDIVIAYEPVWAISGHAGATPCDPATALAMYRVIRRSAPHSRIVYGGSVSSKDVTKYLDVGFSGALVGRSSTSAREYATILRVVSMHYQLP